MSSSSVVRQMERETRKQREPASEPARYIYIYIYIYKREREREEGGGGEGGGD